MTTIRRFGLVGDVHAEDGCLATALDSLAGKGVDRILCVGDICDGRGDVDRCVDLLRRYGVATVRGNHDRWAYQSDLRFLPNATRFDDLTETTCRYLERLPTTLRLETVAGPLLLCHGVGTDDMAFLRDVAPERVLRAHPHFGIEMDIRTLVGGHTHARCVQKYGSRLTVINAGTLRVGDNPCFGVVDLAGHFVQFYSLDEHEGPPREAERVALDY